MAKIICFSNQKGGVGKTTTTATVAAGYRAMGFRVLAVDLDPQGSLSFCLGVDSRDDNPTIYDVMRGEVSLLECVQLPDETYNGLGLVPANILLSGIELEFTNSGREYLLTEALMPAQNLYDYIFIDTPPALGILTVNAFTAADAIVIPMLPDIFSLQGIAQLHDTVDRVRRYCNPALAYAGIVMTRCEPGTVMAREIRGTARMIARELGIPVFDTMIRANVAVCEAQSLQQDIMSYAPKNPVAKDYKMLLKEMRRKGI